MFLLYFFYYSLIYLLLLASLALVAIFLFYKHQHGYWKRIGVPYIQPEFIYGNTKRRIKLEATYSKVLDEWYKSSRTKGHKYIGFYSLFNPRLLVIDTDLIKKMLLKDFEHFSSHGINVDEEKDPLSGNLFNFHGARWKYMRQKLSPVFTSGKLKNMFPILVDCSKELDHCLDETVSRSEPFEIKQLISLYTSDVICSCAFGIESNSFKDPKNAIYKISLLHTNPTGLNKFKYFFGRYFPNAAKILHIEQYNSKIFHFFTNMVRETIDYREANNVTRNDFLQSLIDLKAKNCYEKDHTNLTFQEIVAEVYLFFQGGTDTSSSTITFAMYELAKNSEIQSKVRDEIRQVLKKHGGELNYESVMQLKYMERVIKETSRMHPPLEILTRQVTKDYELPEDNVTFKKGLLVYIPALSIHYDPEYYPDPFKFDPDRHLEENKRNRPDFTYLPFGEGYRICLGMRFGMMQTKVGLCRLLSNYKFTLNQKTHDPLIIDPNAVMRFAKDGIWLNVEKIRS